jgi:hypothetical protein
LLRELSKEEIKKIVHDDPVRPHISAAWRCRSGREVYGLFNDVTGDIRAVICVAYTDEVPSCERDMGWVGTNVAVFYTVWSYDKGAGKEIVLSVADHINCKNHYVKRFVTLSPLTNMAERFHIKNGASFLNRHIKCQNFEYFLQPVEL